MFSREVEGQTSDGVRKHETTARHSRQFRHPAEALARAHGISFEVLVHKCRDGLLEIMREIPDGTEEQEVCNCRSELLNI